MRVLGLDYGSKRVGVAVSDELKIIAQPLEYIPAEPFEGLAARLRELIAEKEVELVLVGMPRNMNGTHGAAAESVKRFLEELRPQISIPIKTWDERLTSTQANRVLVQGGVRRDKRKQKVDQTAAAILLQSYLDSLSL